MIYWYKKFGICLPKQHFDIEISFLLHKRNTDIQSGHVNFTTNQNDMFVTPLIRKDIHETHASVGTLLLLADELLQQRLFDGVLGVSPELFITLTPRTIQSATQCALRWCSGGAGDQ